MACCKYLVDSAAGFRAWCELLPSNRIHNGQYYWIKGILFSFVILVKLGRVEDISKREKHVGITRGDFEYVFKLLLGWLPFLLLQMEVTEKAPGLRMRLVNGKGFYTQGATTLVG
jgi:hypothetical protein